MAVVTDQVEATGPEVDDDAVGPETPAKGRALLHSGPWSPCGRWWRPSWRCSRCSA